ncbi:efflux RND transporter periplasmic adaptor subunit [Solimonas marina]|uniref:Efflux RND transporter periplasmic adaptor subunit n=1 Tax=Solimonas marina TaxID=2714601 RepID=A0A969WDV1_9GAMM|nr:efflux RND transporter periplasmic adaptor subunit [Solimonas marina]NKF24168.1 efflux RND transporter periplasmic adaptor subunit [Solimonas marina]
MSPTNQTQPPAAPRGLRTAGIVAAVIAALIVVVGLTARARSNSQVAQWTEAHAIPTVKIVTPQPLGAGSGLQLPARLEAYSTAPIYARVNGYLKDWKVDIGTHVKAGQLLAEVETPDLDQQLAQARANLIQAKADEKLAESTAKRWQGMLGTDAVSKQEVDEKVGDYAAKKAAAQAAQAAVDALAATQGFKRIAAPFDGIVTSRNTDVGQLISSNGSGTPLFTVSDTHKLRVYVQVPQSYVPDIKVGSEAQLVVPERPGKTFDAKVESTSGAIDAMSGASLVQLVVDNDKGQLLAGGYADITLTVPPDGDSLTIPGSALIFDAGGVRVAVVGTDNKVSMKPITINRDLGKSLEVSGLSKSDRVIDSPFDSLMAGDEVQIAPEQPDADATKTKKS